MPATRANDDGRIARSVELILYLLYRCVQNLLFNFLPFAILPVELCREHRCFAVIGSEQ